MPLDGNALKLLHYPYLNELYVITVGWYDCEIKLLSTSTLEFVIQDKL